MWVRLTLWGHQYQAVKVSSSQGQLAVSGGIRFDSEKKASYVMLRLRATSPDIRPPHHRALSGCDDLIAVAQSPKEQEAMEWYSGLPDGSVDLRVEARVAGSGDEDTTVSLVPDVRLKLMLAPSQAGIDTHAPHVRACRRRCLQALPASLQPVALLSARAPVRAVVLEQINC